MYTGVWIYDIEVLFNFFCVTFRHRDTKEKVHFRIWKEQNDLHPVFLLSFYEFMDSRVSGLVGYNNLKYDWPVMNYLLRSRRKWLRMTGEEVAMALHAFSNKLLNQKFSEVRDPDIPQLDLFRVYHFDNIHKAVSLKMLQITLGWHTVADMPIHHTSIITTEEQANIIEWYNTNDVDSTMFFYEHKKTKEAVAMRQELSELFGIDFLNANDAKIGELIIIHRLAKKMGLSLKEVKEMRTPRPVLPFSECILPSISFNFKGFNGILSKFKASRFVYEPPPAEGEKKKKKKDEEEFVTIYDGLEYYFGMGGIHAVRASGVYEEDAERIILSADVSSYYINLAIANDFGPEHFGGYFTPECQEIYNERSRHKKGTAINSGLKLGLTAIFGKSKSEFSPLYDPKYQLQTTLNGQLLLADLCEVVTEAGGRILMANTDGIEIHVRREDEQKIRDVCASWAERVKLSLEYKQYKRLFIRDVNNYIGEFHDGKSYNKGAYEFEDLKFDKDHSMLCVPYAAQELLLRGKSIQESFAESTLNSFFIGKRAKNRGEFELREVDNSGDEAKVNITQFQRTVRYLVTKKGGWLFKKNEEAGTVSRIDDPWKITMCMTAPDESARELIDYRFYEQEVLKLTRPILQTQTSFL